ncbi:reverse transcriptase-like protein [Niallia taxi]|uniref:reverse transcriptase-like protein n=1 Tax=Niallia taxi TaxID=2499688 RepID=UPI0011A0891B|nr:reverse transcriptase-like protein [Niallia taxi]MCT2345381.1 reverse transcriptase-like protein [Niallia taxi]MDE5051944.1 reverse transcriptase-like protein [Niallia taxi]MED3961796.1 reverse transcriptase-like protein [Niallia taxi]WOD61089.1 reverse transcriptase-like protein [Niallia taxi]
MKYKLEYRYRVKKEEVFFTSDWVVQSTAIVIGEDLEKSKQGIDLTFYDENGTEWSLKELIKLHAEVEEEPHDFTIFFDGGYRKETNTAGLGVILYFNQGKKKYRIRANELFHEMETNNEAEYAALYHALNLLEELEVKGVTCEFKGDSQVVLNQLSGEWPCYEEALNKWLDRIEKKLSDLKINAIYTPIGRNENKEADKLATQALAEKRIYSKMQII